MFRKKILIISYTDHGKDPRVNKQLEFLRNEYKIFTAGTQKAKIDNIEFVKIELRKKNLIYRLFRIILVVFKKYDELSCYSLKNYKELIYLLNKKYDLIIANDLETLPLAFTISKRKIKVLFDAHGYYPLEFENKLIWRLIYQKYYLYLCSKYLKYCDKITNVCEAIADKYRENFGVSSEIITNASDYLNLRPSETDNKKVRIIYHGAVIPDRKIENIINMMDYMDRRFSLDLVLVYPKECKESNRYVKKLKLQSVGKNINYLSPFPFKKIVESINKYDIGLYILSPTNFNNKYALPNKFFEYIQARLAMAIGPSPEMAKIVNKYDLGIVAMDFTARAMAEKINGLTREKIMYYKNNAQKAAKELSSLVNKNKLENIVKKLTEKS